ncbi:MULTISPECIES: amino acid ABC transporter permease [unclassified Modicisalibacter]|uniref:amino acid ABC transporter permease n=1 Tax=unclassified Modicisalibacter TaxID=2679913 RepID=UPI001CCF8EC6|nr:MULTISPECIES: amino acid ABC transporter permease [unclassified Modicisalibacter]MBZ9558469.1 amino acid ABC transporter permease [Modicisalibacter sp. R2A 31.J]MBZ9575639.1 amino acid ABC transporter permease [Modicisalibacter sp. MOD 31.J]
MNYHFNFTPILEQWPLLLSGIGLGLVLALVSIAIGSAIGLVVAFATRAPNGWIRGIAFTWISVLRNLPILVIVLFLFFGMPQLGLSLDKITSFIVALSLYASAYMAEVFRGGLLSVPQGLVEAGQAIGLTPLRIKRHIVLPIMFRNALPAFGNNFVSLFKDTSLAATIAVPELTFYARKINSETFRVIEVWLIASLLYIVCCYAITLILRALERRLVLEAK